MSWLFIDEAQDLNRPQAEFVDVLKDRTDCRIFTIADDDQGIYKFRGASSQFLRDFKGRTTIQLTRNFRSTQSIIEVCRHWIEPNSDELDLPAKPLHSDREGLPVILLTARFAGARGRHAKILLEAARKNGLIRGFGEVAALSFSPNGRHSELEF